MKYSVIIPVWNHCDLTRQALEGIARREQQDYEVIVVDNGSADDTPQVIDAMLNRLPPSKYHYLPENMGFPVAANIGLNDASGEYLVLLNNDVTVQDANWLDRLFTPLRDNPRQLVGPTLHLQNPWSLVDGVFHPYIEGWCLGFHRQALTDIGYLDEVFSPGSFEDTDFSFRAVQAGYKLTQVQCGLHHLYNRTWWDVENAKEVSLRNQRIYQEKVRVALNGN